MTLSAGIGYALIALGPAVSLFVTVVALKPFLVLTVLTSTLVWLISLIILSAVWRAFLPVGSSTGLLFLLLLTCVSFQEVIRPLFYWRLYKKVEVFLNLLAEKMAKPRLQFTDKMQIALAGGLGHGIAHAVFFCLSLLTPSFGPATYYATSCSQMPLFLVGALMALSFLAMHTFSMVIAFSGYEDENRKLQVFVPALHFVTSFLTLVNLLPGGCVAGVPLALASASGAVLYCGKIVWDKVTFLSNSGRTNILS